jgi:hypothetical protein
LTDQLYEETTESLKARAKKLRRELEAVERELTKRRMIEKRTGTAWRKE